MVKLGVRTDLVPKVDRTALPTWCGRFALLYGDIANNVWYATHHQKRVRQITAKLNDQTLMETYPEGSPARTEAQAALARQTEALRRREERLDELTWQFPAFWNARPDGVDEWLRSEWFAYGNDTDEVCAFMLNRDSGPAWKEVYQHWVDREPPINDEGVPF